MLQRSVCNLQTTVIGNIFTQCQCTVCIQSRQYFNLVEEVYHYFCTFCKAFCIAFCPPVFQVTIFIELTSLVIESVSHFMSDYYTDSSIVTSIICIHIEERILQNSSRETDFVCRRIVVCIDSLRSHQPFILIYRFADTAQHIIQSPFSCTTHVSPIRIFFYLQSRIILPFVRITDFYMESIQFFQCSHFSTVAHPFLCLDTFTQSYL